MGKECARRSAVKRIYVVTEGQSETNFVKRVLSPYFLSCGKIFIPTTVLTKKDERKGKMHKGGMSNFAKAQTTIKQDLAYTNSSDVFVTTMFDFYGLPTDTPGFAEAKKLSDPYKKVACLEQKILDYENLTNQAVFHPYIQLHEFEALLFSDIDLLGDEYFEYDIQPLKDCIAQKKNPELINDGSETAPSKRILDCIPDYDKTTAGVSVLEKIGVEVLCNRCLHFAEWIDWIKSI